MNEREVHITSKHLQKVISEWEVLLNKNKYNQDFINKKEIQIESWKVQLEELQREYIEYFI